MLVRRRVIHDIRPISREDIIHTVGIAHRCDQYHQVKLRIFLFQFLLNIIDRILINIHDHQLFRLMCGDLPAKFTADRAAAARDKDDFTLHIAEDRVHIDADRVSSQQILHFHVPQLTDADFPVHQLIHARQRTQFAVRVLTDLQDLSDICPRS